MIKPETLELSADVEDDLPELFSDRDKLRQILLNLLGNAVKFTERGQIRVAARREQEWIAVAVTDTGPGIPKDKLGFIFQEFRQLDGGATRPHGGTGLGLSISRHLARLLGGDIFVESVEGCGSTFTVKVAARYRASELPKRSETMRVPEIAGQAAS
jgi:signal transduction histidine kinase